MVTRKDVIASEAFMRYVNATQAEGVTEALSKSTRDFQKLLKKMPGKKINYAYAEGKWTIKELLQHIIDAERVFAYRALTFAREDNAKLPSFDENTWAITSNATKRKWNDLVEEFRALRTTTELLFNSLDDDRLLKTGTAGVNTINVVGLGFVCAGHVAHHINIIKERYLADTAEGETKKKKAKKKKK